MLRRSIVQGILLLPAVTARAQTAPQPYPSRPIRFIVPFPAGGPTDSIARVLADQLRTVLGQPVVVLNKAGAGGNIGLEEAARSAPDGYTIVLITTTTSAINPTLYKSLMYDPLRDITPIAIIAKATYLLVAKRSLPASLSELLAAIKSRPGVFNGAYASTTSQVANAAFRKTFSLDFEDVPFKGDAEALNALMGGDVDFYFTVSPQVGTFVRSGRLNAVAVSGQRRSPLVPDVLTFAEAGVPGFVDLTAWYGVAAPSGVPQAIIERLNHETAKIVGSSEFHSRLSQMGLESTINTPAEAQQIVSAEAARWRILIRDSGVTIQ